MNTYRDKWNKIVDCFERERGKKEKQIQKKWEAVFSEVLGYSALEGDIDSQRRVQIGSTQSVIPDIVIRSDNNDLFLVELKQSSLDCGHEQLFSYFKLLKLDIGVLICNRIYLYNYDITKSDSEQQGLEILFEHNNPVGEKFVELFEKHNFDKMSVKSYIEENAKSGQEIQHSISKEASPVSPEEDIDKVSIRKLCHSNGIYVSKDFTKAKKNSSENLYWANPNKKKLLSDWWLVLVDYPVKALHCFMIPANSIKCNELKYRSNGRIDLQIYYNDSEFTDSRSKISFRRWLVQTIKYSE